MFDWILHIIESGGYIGIFSLMVLENLFPPIPSELIIPLAGFSAAKGDLNIVGVLFATLSGGLVGCIPWYVLGRVYGIQRLKKLTERFGRILTLTSRDIDAAEAWFATYGTFAVFFGRLIPTVRTLISVPAGIAKMSFTSFLVYSLLGSAIWTSLLLFVGYSLQSQYTQTISSNINTVSNGVVILVVLIYVYRVITYSNKK